MKRIHISSGTAPVRHKSAVKVNGRQMLYCITLRPLFFRHSTPRQRVATVLHELFHISKHFDGTLDHLRRHEEAGEGFEAEFAPIERRVWKSLPPELVAPLAGVQRVRARAAGKAGARIRRRDSPGENATT